MKANIKKELLNSIGKIYEASKGCKLKPSVFTDTKNELLRVSDYFKISQIQAFLVANVYSMNYKSNTIELNDLIKYFECNPMQILQYSEDIKQLTEAKIFDVSKGGRSKLQFASNEYTVNSQVSDAILSNKPLPRLTKEIQNVFEVLEIITNCGKQRSDDEIKTSELFNLTRKTIKKNTHFPLVKIINDFKLSDVDTYFYVFTIWEIISGNSSVEVEDTAKDIFEVIPQKIIYAQQMLKEKNPLIEKGLLKLEEDNYTFTRSNIMLTEKSKDILNKSGITIFKEKIITSIFDLLEEISGLIDLRRNNEINFRELRMKMRILLGENEEFPLVKKIDSINLGLIDFLLFIHLIWETFLGKESINLSRTLETIFVSASKRVDYLKEFLAKKNPLVKNNFVEIDKHQFFNDNTIKLSSKSINLVKKCGVDISINEKNKENILSPKDIPLRKLIFSKDDMQQIFVVQDLLQKDKFRQTQKRLTEKKLSKGIAILLHGVPGTGKTEVVKQIAKATNRRLMKVDISQSKSMWFGESEKQIKKIFTDYKDLSKECRQTPILLFNEADAIISKRKDVGSSSVAKTENSIQNIILEELENFEGVLMATTNLIENLDSAFERRFLFKIPFKKPNVKIRAQIWQSKIPSLSLDDTKLLAKKFDFSGGQIDNIFRKKEIHEITYGNEVKLGHLIEFCSQEFLVNQHQVIGF